MIKPGIYRHYKNKLYQVIDVATHCETDEQLVVYKPLYGEGKLWVRPVSIFDEEVHLHTAAKSSLLHHRYLYSELEKRLVSYEEKHKKQTAAIAALHAIADLTHKRSLVVIFSDLLDDPAHTNQLFDALQHLKHNKHEVILFHVYHEGYEKSFDLEDRPYQLIDMESGDRMHLQPGEVRLQYQAAIASYFEEIKLRCINNGIDFMPAPIEEGYDQVLLKYLLKRQQLY